MLANTPPYPERIVCLTEETVETLYRIGAGDLVVGVSGFAVRPREVRKKPRVSSFLDANFDRILALEPDLVLGFSDLQADIGRELCKRGVPVMLFNQRSIGEILQNIRVVSAVVGRAEAGVTLADSLRAGLEKIASEATALPRRPRVFIEEWHDPLIAGIRWVSELVELCGGEDICAHLRKEQGARGRIVDPAAIAAQDPEVVIASWCGRKASPARIRSRPGWEAVSAVRHDQLYEVKSTFLLQPGPAALTDGVGQIAAIVQAAAHGKQLGVSSQRDLRQVPWKPTFG